MFIICCKKKCEFRECLLIHMKKISYDSVVFFFRAPVWRDTITNFYFVNKTCHDIALLGIIAQLNCLDKKFIEFYNTGSCESSTKLDFLMKYCFDNYKQFETLSYRLIASLSLNMIREKSNQTTQFEHPFLQYEINQQIRSHSSLSATINYSVKASETKNIQ